MTKTCAVIQGDIRTRHIDEIVSCLGGKFDHVILSCWDGDQEAASSIGCDKIFNTPPASTGLNNRNLQRISASAGLLRAKELGCTHVLKWRSDMLPTRMNVDRLICLSEYRPPVSLGSRIVTCCFRNLTVESDWFSSIPDLFAFGRVDAMTYLWGLGDEFDVARDFNVPSGMERDVGWTWLEGRTNAEIAGFYCPESELYAIFKQRLQDAFGLSLNHRIIAHEYLTLINHESIKICWFRKDGFRSILQAWEHPWWTVGQWRRGRPWVVKPGYEQTYPWQSIRMAQSGFLIRREIRSQKKWYEDFIRNQKVSCF